MVAMMDEFYNSMNIEIFRKWVYFQVQNDPSLTLEQYDERTFKIYYHHRVARFVIWPIGIIEEAIHEGEQLVFYLHYQFQNFHFATDLFYRMLTKLKEESTPETHHILLCCTGGMTTGYFAEKMNKFCELNQIPIQMNATSFYHLESIYQDYEMVLIAPQLRYKMMELKQKLKPTIVESVDPIIFATYDCQGLMKQIRVSYEEKYERKRENA